jgi:hypothetical protein
VITNETGIVGPSCTLTLKSPVPSALIVYERLPALWGSGKRETVDSGTETQVDLVFVFVRGDVNLSELGCFRSQTVFETWSNVSGPGSTAAPAAKRRAKAFIYNSRTMRAPDDWAVTNSVPFRSSA